LVLGSKFSRDKNQKEREAGRGRRGWGDRFMERRNGQIQRQMDIR